MTKQNQEKLYNHFLKYKMLKEAEAIDKIYNFSKKRVKKKVEEPKDESSS